MFDAIIKYPPKDIDLLFMEGTMMKRSNTDFPNEKSVEEKIHKTIKEQKNITFLISSSQNIDRIVSAYRACKRTGKTLIVDAYTAWVLEQVKMVSESTPNIDWNEVMSIVGVIEHDCRERIIAEARYIREPVRPMAEIVFVVEERYRGIGIASYLYRLLARLAKERKIKGFTAEVLFSNTAMMKVFKKGSFPYTKRLEGGAYHLEIDIEDNDHDGCASATHTRQTVDLTE